MVECVREDDDLLRSTLPPATLPIPDQPLPSYTNALPAYKYIHKKIAASISKTMPIKSNP